MDSTISCCQMKCCSADVFRNRRNCYRRLHSARSITIMPDATLLLLLLLVLPETNTAHTINGGETYALKISGLGEGMGRSKKGSIGKRQIREGTGDNGMVTHWSNLVFHAFTIFSLDIYDGVIIMSSCVTQFSSKTLPAPPQAVSSWRCSHASHTTAEDLQGYRTCSRAWPQRNQGQCCA